MNSWPSLLTLPRGYRPAATAIVLSLLLGACASNPTGGANFVLMSQNSEIEKGRELHEEMLKQNPIYEDPELQAYVERIGQKMAAVSHRPELDYVFTIIDSPDINAFALPGGFVYVNRGLLTYLNSEAQLAAVLGHEIGHVTARHAVRQQTAARSASAASIALIFATGVDLRETTSLISGALISGYGRDMELEADSLGADYLYNAGYDPNAMVEVIGVLKNHEDFMKRTSNRGVAYHGLFASHPRNDTRLQEVVGKAGALSQQQETETDPTEFREQMTGLIVGPSLQNAAGGDQRNRYYQSLFNYTLIFPEGWTMEETTTTVTGASMDRESLVRVDARRLQTPVEHPRVFIREELDIPELEQSEELEQFGLVGQTGINPATGERVAVLYMGPRAFIITGQAGEGVSDEVLLETVRSFRPIANNERLFANPVQISYIRASEGVTYSQLATQTRLAEHQEDMLRLLNGDYPFGEPEAGEWVKIAN